MELAQLLHGDIQAKHWFNTSGYVKFEQTVRHLKLSKYLFDEMLLHDVQLLECVEHVRQGDWHS